MGCRRLCSCLVMPTSDQLMWRLAQGTLFSGISEFQGYHSQCCSLYLQKYRNILLETVQSSNPKTSGQVIPKGRIGTRDRSYCDLNTNTWFLRLTLTFHKWIFV